MWYRLFPYVLGGYFANDIIQFVNNLFGKSDDSGVGVTGTRTPRPQGFNFLTLGFLFLAYLIFKEVNK